MRLVFCGTPNFAVPTLQAVLAAGHEVALVLSQPDRAVGRNAIIEPTPVKKTALAHGLPMTQPEKLKNNLELRTQLEAIAPDAILIVAYGRIIPKWMLDLPRYGNLNLHGSLLPRWRGAAPIQWSIAAGDTLTGVTTMRIDAGLDTGDMLLKRELPIGPHTTSADIFATLAPIGAELMVETLRRLEANTITPQKQNNAEATLAPLLTRDDGRIDFTQPAQTIYNRFRGFQPWPGAFATLRGKKLILHAMHLAENLSNHLPGALFLCNGYLTASCGNHTAIVLDELQLEGKKRISAEEFLRGFKIEEGERLV